MGIQCVGGVYKGYLHYLRLKLLLMILSRVGLPESMAISGILERKPFTKKCRTPSMEEHIESEIDKRFDTPAVIARSSGATPILLMKHLLTQTNSGSLTLRLNIVLTPVR